MKIPDHIAKITEQIEAMRTDGHDHNTLINIQLCAIECGTGAILEASHEKPEPFSPPD